MFRFYKVLRNQKGNKPLNQLIIQHEVRETNIFRSLLLTGLSIPVAVINLVILQKSDYTVSSAQQKALNHIITLDQVVLGLSIIIFGILLYSFRNDRWKTITGKYIHHVTFFLITLWATFVTIFDQQVTSSLTTFILGYVICSLMLLIKPQRMLIYLFILGLVFYFGVIQHQFDPMLRITTLSEGITTLIVCFCLSITQWRTNLISFRQSRLIKSQQDALKDKHQDLMSSAAQLEELNVSKDKFFAILAHDLRGPISSTLALTELLEEGFFEEDESERKRMYRLLQNSLNTTGKLLENILLWSRNHTGTLTFKPVYLDFHELVNNNISLLQIVAAQKDISIVNSVNKDLKTTADLDMMNTIIRNLLSNAIKFTPNFGKVEIISGKYYDAGLQQECITISVRDFGIGMSEKTINNLFKIDKKVVSIGTNNETGTGLGLILCNDFLQKHQGKLSVESEEGTGSTFTFTIPHILTSAD